MKDIEYAHYHNPPSRESKTLSLAIRSPLTSHNIRPLFGFDISDLLVN
jgi:hypothetical protein